MSITRSSAAADSTSSGKSSKEGKETKEKVVGCLTLNNVGSQRRFTFLDYVRSGLQIRLALAIDFTRSNAKREPACHGAGVMVGSSPYATAIRAVGKVISTYDVDDKILAYGFGAKIPPTHTVTSDCFALTGDFFDPEVAARFAVAFEGYHFSHHRSTKTCTVTAADQQKFNAAGRAHARTLPTIPASRTVDPN